MRSGEQRLDESKQQDRRKGRGKRKEGSKKNTELTRVINSTAHSCIAQHSTQLQLILFSGLHSNDCAQLTDRYLYTLRRRMGQRRHISTRS